MPGGVPVLGQDDGVALGHEGVDARDDAVAVGDGEGAAGAEVVLQVDDEERVGHGGLGGWRGSGEGGSRPTLHARGPGM